MVFFHRCIRPWALLACLTALSACTTSRPPDIDGASTLKPEPERPVERIEGFSDLKRLVQKMTLSMLESQALADRPVVQLVDEDMPSAAREAMHLIRVTMVKSGKVRVMVLISDSKDAPIRHRTQNSIYRYTPKQTITPINPQYMIGIALLPVATLPTHYKFTLTLYDRELNIVWQDEQEIEQVHMPLAPGEVWHHPPRPAMPQER